MNELMNEITDETMTEMLTETVNETEIDVDESVEIVNETVADAASELVGETVHETVNNPSLTETCKDLAARYAWKGEAITHLPTDLYIPPDAMEVILEIFEGPLDLLLYLIKKHNLDILNIPVADITRQYMEYVEVMRVFRLELAADYLEMAALLTEIKSRMLLPRPETGTEEEVDPRAELVRRLQEYERFKIAAENLDSMPRFGRELFPAMAHTADLEVTKIHPHVDLKDILSAFKDVLMRADMQTAHTIQREVLSVREKMSRILSKLQGEKFMDFTTFFDLSEGRLGVVVSFLAILELVREALVELVQNEMFGPIYIRAVGC